MNNPFRIVFLLAAAMSLAVNAVPLRAQEVRSHESRAFRGGLQAGLAADRSSFSWPNDGTDRSSLEVDARQNGFLGLTLDFVLGRDLLLEFAPQYGQRNVPIATLQRRSGTSFTILQDPVDYVGIPMLVKYLFLRDGLILPYLGAGAEFGLNLTSLYVTVEEYRFTGENMTTSTVAFRRNLNQLYGSVLLEAGLDIRASEDWSVLLGVRYSQELTPLVDDPLLTWETPHNWRMRFAVLYSLGRGF